MDHPARRLGRLEVTEGVLSGVGDVQESRKKQSGVSKKREPKLVRGEGDTRDDYVPILVLVLFVDAAHERGGRREDLVDEDEDGLLWRELDSLADDIDELAYCQIRRHQVLLLVDSRDIRLFDLLAYDLQGHGGLA